MRLPPTPSCIVPPTLPRQAVAFLSLSGHPIRGHSPHSSLSSILASMKFSSYLMPEARGTRAAPGGAGCWGLLSLPQQTQACSEHVRRQHTAGGFCVLCSTCLQPELGAGPWGWPTGLGSVAKLASPPSLQCHPKSCLSL